MTELRVCIGSACHLNGARNVIASFRHMIEEHDLHDKIKFEAAFCMRRCSKEGVSVSVDGEDYRVMPETAVKFFEETVMPKIK